MNAAVGKGHLFNSRKNNFEFISPGTFILIILYLVIIIHLFIKK
mgnify:CR=1 FL=1